MRPCCGRRRGDVEPREEFHARDDGVVQFCWRFERGNEDVVDADAGRQTGACCFEVDVGSAGVVGVADEAVDVADDRRLGGEVADVGGLCIVRGRTVNGVSSAVAASRRWRSSESKSHNAMLHSPLRSYYR
jgi:hypothetical protein